MLEIGARFNRLEILEYKGKDKWGSRLYLYRCDCGKEKITRESDLTHGKVQSCGCLKNELVSARMTTHGRTHTQEHNTWAGMRQRCYYKKNRQYHLYGAKGIKVDPAWRDSFEQFFADMGPKPDKHYSLERIDSNKDYTKDNCKWATPKEQANNTSRNRMLTYKGQTKSLTLLAEEYGIGRTTLCNRLFIQKLSLEEALTRPLQYGKTRKPLSPKSILEAA